MLVGQATTRRTLVALIEQHRHACDDFGRVAERVDHWDSPTPCDEWNARVLVEHVIGFHDFLLLRPLGVRANRPREDPAARWRATSDALFTALAAPDVLDRDTELPGGGTSTPRTMLAALTTDVLVHTWDLARAAGVDPHLDEDLCIDALANAEQPPLNRARGMVGPERDAPAGADAATRLAAYYGRDPLWTAPREQ